LVLQFLICVYDFASADHFSECVESHDFEIYDKFIKEQGGIWDVLSFLLSENGIYFVT